MRLSPALNAPSVCLQGAGGTEWKDLRGFLYLILFRRGPSHYVWEAQGRLGHKGLKPERACVCEWVCVRVFFLGIICRIGSFFKKTCGKRLQTDFSVRQVPARPSAFSFTSLSVCSQPIPSIHPSLSPSASPFPSSTNQIRLTCRPCAKHTQSNSFQVIGRNANLKGEFY